MPLGDARGAAWVEFSKGRLDLLVGCWKGTNRYFRNAGNGKFIDRTDDIGLGSRMFNTTAIAVPDLSKDGTPDVVFNNEGQDPVLFMTNPEFFAEPPPQLVAVPPGIGGPAVNGISNLGIGLGGLILGGILLMITSRGRTGKAALIALALLLAGASSNATSAEWSTARGNPQRTGNIDDKNGPKTFPNVFGFTKPPRIISSPHPSLATKCCTRP